MISQFHFKNFDVDEVTRSVANLALVRILDLAPYGSKAVAVLEKQPEGYCCSVDVYSRRGLFVASVVRATAADAIHAIEKKLKKQIKSRSSQRFVLEEAEVA
jgi:hypothetical protein